MNGSAPELSIIIPAYNEEGRLPETLRRIRNFLETRRVRAEVIVVDDGSRDATAALVAGWRAEWPALQLLSNGRNRGKGYSVRHGMLEARGRLVLFTDADLSAPIEEADKLLRALGGYDMAIGSRALDRGLIEVHQSPLREFAGILFNQLVRLVTGLRFSDTQCGFKAFVRARAKIVFEQQRIERFGFDPEILFLAKLHGLRAVEVPVRWAHDPATKIHVLRDGLRMFAEVLLIRWYWLLGRYPQAPSA
ncbi:MAG TPA: dolichyl-phosphate beta-glucosyltransferase [Candidatus Acidoferrales bacterium]|nr:dolichyl-phosphate beta-glucosyltransferase [Candidatus Acidoferrales bacterium]